jgi:hypothetical protein
MAAETAIPGFLHWHAALALLAPGMWLMAAAPGVGVAPGVRLGRVLAGLVAVVGLVLVGLIVRMDLLLGRWWGDLNGGFVHAGLLAILPAVIAAAWTAWRSEGGPGRRLWQGGGAWLLVVWGLPVGALAATGALPVLLRLVYVPLVVIALLLALTSPVLSQLAGAVVVLVAAPAWRPAAALALIVAGAAWWWPVAA